MVSAPPPEVDPRRVRIGLIFLTAVVLIALVLAVVVESPLAKLVMSGIIVFTVARTFVLARSRRRDS